MNNKVLIVATHPDDETFGCGGTLLKHKDSGDEIHWLICTETNSDKEFYNIRKKEIKEVSDLYKFNSVSNLRLKTTCIDGYSISDLIEKISIIINKIKPNIIYLPFKGDVHSDHRLIFSACYSCTKSFRYPFIKKIYMMETLSETDFSPSTIEESFIPNTFIDISKYIDLKIKIMKVYKSEIGIHPFPRSEHSVRSLNSFRGCSANADYAESFVLLKEIS